MCAMCARRPSSAFIVSRVVTQLPPNPQVVRVDVQGMREAEIRRGLGQRDQDLPRRHREARHDVVEAGDVAAARLPRLHPARIDGLDPVALRRAQEPGDDVPELFELAGPQAIQDELVVAGQDEEPLVDHGSVLELLVGVAGPQRRHGRVEHRRVAQARVAVSGGERGRRAAHDPRARVGGAADRRGLAVILMPHTFLPVAGSQAMNSPRFPPRPGEHQHVRAHVRARRRCTSPRRPRSSCRCCWCPRR